MKKLILLILVLTLSLTLILPAFTGEISVAVSRLISLDATNWMHLPLSGTGTVTLQCRTAVDTYIATSASPGNNYWTIKSGTAVTIGLKIAGDAGLFGKAASAPVWLEIISLSE